MFSCVLCHSCISCIICTCCCQITNILHVWTMTMTLNYLNDEYQCLEVEYKLSLNLLIGLGTSRYTTFIAAVMCLWCYTSVICLCLTEPRLGQKTQHPTINRLRHPTAIINNVCRYGDSEKRRWAFRGTENCRVHATSDLRGPPGRWTSEVEYVRETRLGHTRGSLEMRTGCGASATANTHTHGCTIHTTQFR